ncbi:low temperature requirement protein A [Tenggerimyces flavus]|uniref:Low temperature requirement protein A n=1 Tax=Tenggerimyces flavus TaxID=1708749 RepID=A0ABV7YAE8_9ACTN|nr:low temperature requirement protein A [Tenggerimyces flavus]MBM7783719.1 low temperature requirement protein LtrA [Tenggerimyces flavus]
MAEGARRWRMPMVARDRDEEHRAATPLELLFDLCFVVAVAQAAVSLHHALAENHAAEGVLAYAMVFFAIFWAWMNFTWFASAYDTDDVPYRILTLVQIAGVLVLAAGVPATFEHHNYLLVTIGYAIMRTAMIAQWVRAAIEHPEGRQTALRYAIGIGIVQVGWLVRLALPESIGIAGFAILVVLELLVPVWAERTGGRTTSWHPAHIAERYGLFTIIVLGEVVLASTIAIQTAGTDHGVSSSLLILAGGGLLLIFSMWWAYFKRPAIGGLRLSDGSAFIWGYGHYAIFAAGAALGAGIEVAAETIEHAVPVTDTAAAFAVAVPVAVFLVVTGLLQTRMSSDRPVLLRFCVTAVLVLAAAAVPMSLAVAVLVMGILTTVLISIDVIQAHQTLRRANASSA